MAKSEVKSKRKPRFRVGQIVIVIDDDCILRLEAAKCYGGDWRYSAQHGTEWQESELRPLTQTERGEGGRRGK